MLFDSPPDSWQVSTLGVICQEGGGDIQTGPFGSQLHASDYVLSGIPSIMPANIKEGRVSEEGIARISEADATRLSKYLTKAGDIVYSRRGDVERCALIRKREEGWLCGTGCLRVRPGSGVVDPDFCSHFLSHPETKEWISRHAVGATMPNLNTQILSALPVLLPSLQEQKAIAHILGTLDDKIELNRKTNETLEAMAKALFKSWFVDFDPVRAKAEGRPTGLPAEISDLFPDSFEDSELGEIPRGWQCCSFTKLIDVISGGTPKTSIDEYWNGSIPWFSVVDAPPGSGCWAIQTEKRITPEGLANCSSKLLPTGTTIISARGTVGKVCLAGRDMAMNQSCYGLRSKAENGEFFCFYLTKSLVEILEARAHGSVFSTITRDTLDGVATISPSLEAIQSFNRSTGALLGKIKANLDENRILGNQRDALLPKLISGELRIPDAEKLLEEVGV